MTYFEGFCENSALFALGKYNDTCIKLLWNFSLIEVQHAKQAFFDELPADVCLAQFFLTLLPNVKEACWLGRTPY